MSKLKDSLIQFSRSFKESAQQLEHLLSEVVDDPHLDRPSTSQGRTGKLQFHRLNIATPVSSYTK